MRPVVCGEAHVDEHVLAEAHDIGSVENRLGLGCEVHVIFDKRFVCRAIVLRVIGAVELVSHQRLRRARPQHLGVALVVVVQDATVRPVLKEARSPRHSSFNNLIPKHQKEVARAC